jgi:hypothetical protein
VLSRFAGSEGFSPTRPGIRAALIESYLAEAEVIDPRLTLGTDEGYARPGRASEAESPSAALDDVLPAAAAQKVLADQTALWSGCSGSGLTQSDGGLPKLSVARKSCGADGAMVLVPNSCRRRPHA